MPKHESTGLKDWPKISKEKSVGHVWIDLCDKAFLDILPGGWAGADLPA